MAFSAHSKSWFLAPQLNIPVDGYLQLGSLITNPTHVDKPINSNSRIPLAPDEEVNQTEYTDLQQLEYHKSGQSVLSAYLQYVGGLGKDTQETTRLEADKTIYLQFAPTLDYLKKSVSSGEVRAYLDRGWFHPPVYMITGLMIAQGARYQRSGDVNLSVEAGILAEAGVPVEAGISVEAGSSVKNIQFSLPASEFIYAYTLRKINVRKLPTTSAKTSEKVAVSGTQFVADDKIKDTRLPPGKIPEPSRRSKLDKLPGPSEGSEPEVEAESEDEYAPDEIKPLRILCLDGGGVRGIESLCILKDIMVQVASEESKRSVQTPGNTVSQPRHTQQENGKGGKGQKSFHEQPPPCAKPCEYFDLICGTSTGGLIALMLGRLRYTIDEAIVAYSDLATKVFTAKSSRAEIRYDAKVLQDCVIGVIEKSGLDGEAMMEEPTGCKTFVVTSALLENGSVPFLMRTYHLPLDPPFPARIWQAARATSAAPTYFAPITIETTSSYPDARSSKNDESCTGNSVSMTFGDGGTTANNPTMEALLELHELWPFRKVGCIVSLGTGLDKAPQLQRSKGMLTWTLNKLPIVPKYVLMAEVAKYCVAVATDCEKTHGQVLAVMRSLGPQWEEAYFRFNRPHDEKIKLDDHARVKEMQRDTTEWMKRQNEAKCKVAANLVNPEAQRDMRINLHWGLMSLDPTDDPVFSPWTTPSFQSSALPAPREGYAVSRSNSLQGTIPHKEGIQWTWPRYVNAQYSSAQSLIFYHYDQRTKSSRTLLRHSPREKSIFHDRRDEGESAVAVIEPTSNASFVSTRFTRKWQIVPLQLGDQPKKAFRIGENQVEMEADSYVWLTYRCSGMPKERRSCFWVLDSDEFEILFGVEERTRLRFTNVVATSKEAWPTVL